MPERNRRCAGANDPTTCRGVARVNDMLRDEAPGLTLIGPSARVHPTADVERGVTIGPRSSVWNGAQLRRGACIGADCIVGHSLTGVRVGSPVVRAGNRGVQSDAMGVSRAGGRPGRTKQASQRRVSGARARHRPRASRRGTVGHRPQKPSAGMSEEDSRPAAPGRQGAAATSAGPATAATACTLPGSDPTTAATSTSSSPRA
jgi:hypothetical protein